MAVVLATETETQKLKSIEELHPVLMSATEVTVLDIETTGFSPDKFAEIIEIGAVKLNITKREITGYFSQLIRPSNTFTIPAHISELTTITWPQVEDKPYIEEVLPVFAKFLGDSPIVAHNAQFDWPRFLIPYFRTVGHIATNEAICSMNLAKHLYPGRGRNGYNLEALCEMYGYKMQGHHRACMDCKWTASLFLRMLDDYRALHQDEGFSLFAGSSGLNPAPSTVGNVNLSDVKISRVSYDKGQSARHGGRIYVSTNFGRICYSVRRRLWTVVDLWVDRNIPAQAWGNQILALLRMDADTFVRTYTPKSVLA